MKRKGRTADDKQHESCGVWLDTSALKRRKLQNLIGKPDIKNTEPIPSSPSKAPLPCTKQTSISNSSRAQPSGEREINTSKQLPAGASNSASNLTNHELLAGERTSLLTSLIQPVLMQEYKQQVVEKPQHISPWNSFLAEPQSNSCVLSYIKGEDSTTAQGENPLSLNFSQHQKEKGLLDQGAVSKSPLREKNGDWKKEKPATVACQGSPNLKIERASDKRTKGCRRYKPPSSCNDSSFIESSDSENIDPQLGTNITEMSPMKNFSKTLPGFCLKSNGICSENSQVDVTNSLFTQDSEGHKVISHRFFREQTPLSQQGKSSSGVSPSHKNCFGACYPVERRPHVSPGRSLSVLADISQKSCYDLLFTEDSEGNKVLKH
ncbi:aurora kinase A and ninein-interacting protein [Sceloporus undulatus]|uniref:aurora kinase A and ninein-interacting protein n=1 Tax=Sceloporus undulatus TaxID=8520 RepID=UPI001C4B475F|nr:aurora kinase A and ninein-interacting protein [Sceloporus undulatus]XP_042295191.1 aurora kinase A and ninein-interacting protein [Sceloporus undulatus]XP_042295192.1 aurora kinase A and ninein-interacting protein [Sceloporus undulatus]XP_042295193.1 aurora kinase A and ninein-interacting protein [Sceloporus undulatus]